MNRRSFFKRVMGGLAALPFLGGKAKAVDAEFEKEMEKMESWKAEVEAIIPEKRNLTVMTMTRDSNIVDSWHVVDCTIGEDGEVKTRTRVLEFDKE